MQNAPFGAFCNTFDLHKAIVGLKTNFWSFLDCPLTHVLLNVLAKQHFNTGYDLMSS